MKQEFKLCSGGLLFWQRVRKSLGVSYMTISGSYNHSNKCASINLDMIYDHCIRNGITEPIKAVVSTITHETLHAAIKQSIERRPGEDELFVLRFTKELMKGVVA